ncbi:MAG: neutral/alkaline non-lysosomal ceramidase N-terminal domain-containing protein [Prolixibacteraceae bacterium]
MILKKQTVIFLAGLFSLMTLVFPADVTARASDGDSGWKAGIARARITPKEPVWMGGYAFRDHPAERKQTDLWTKVLAIEDQSGKRAVLITLDLAGLPKPFSDRIRDSLQRKYSLTRDQVLLNVSHTHSGPVLKGNLPDIYPMDSAQWDDVARYTRCLENRIVKLVGKALQSMKPAWLYSGSGVSRFQVNRRNNHEKTLTAQTELKGPNDYAVPVLKVADRRGKLKAVAFGYACHGTVLNGYEWSADYMGYAQTELEKLHRRVTALFFQGAGGDQNPLPRRSVPLARQYGSELACVVERVLSEEMKLLDPVLTTTYSEIELTLEDPPSPEKLAVTARDSTGYIQRWGRRLLSRIENGERLESTYPYPLEVWKLGSQLIFALGGEPTIEYAIRIKRLFGQDSFVMGYSNDVMAYIPSVSILKEGGYEGHTSQMAFGLPARWKVTIEEQILQELVKMVQPAEQDTKQHP